MLGQCVPCLRTCLLPAGDQLYSDGVFQAGGSAALLAWGDGQDQ